MKSQIFLIIMTSFYSSIFIVSDAEWFKDSDHLDSAFWTLESLLLDILPYGEEEYEVLRAFGASKVVLRHSVILDIQE